MFYMENTFIQMRKAILKREYFDRLFVRLLSSDAPDCHQQQEEIALSGSKVTSLGAVDDYDGLQKAFT